MSNEKDFNDVAGTDQSVDITPLGRLVAAAPAAAQPWIETYGLPLLRLDIQQRASALALLYAGDTEGPLRAALSVMTPDELVAEAKAFTASDTAHADDNAARVALQRKAAAAACGVILSLIVAGV